MAVTISSCQGKKALSLFESIPELIHKDDPYFVPPFPGSITKILGDKSPFVRHGGTIVPLVAWKDGKVVGRIAAIVNPAHNQYYQDKVGFFGFFDFIDDFEVASALLEAARSELSKRGLTSLRGPYNPTVNDECGVLVEGFDRIPFVMMPYNPPYYLPIYDRLGLQKARDLYAFYISGATETPERIEKIVARVKRTTGVQVRNIQLSRLGDELKIIHKLYNETLDRNWGFVPVSLEDLQFAAGDLKAIVDPSLVMIAEKNGVPVGFSMVIPNINEIMARAKSSNGLWRILKFIWLLKTSRPSEARLAVLGVSPEFRNKGIAALFYYETLVRGRQKFKGGELSWVEETNTEMINAIQVMGGNRYKNYRIYETSLSAGASA